MMLFQVVSNGQKAKITPLEHGVNEFERLISCRGLSFGQGVFETIAVVDQQPILMQEHLSRMAQGAAALGLPFCSQGICQLLTSALDEEKRAGCIAKLTLFADAAQVRGYSCASATSALLRVELFESKVNNQPCSLVRVADPIYPWPQAFVGLKLTHAAQYVHWSNQAKEKGFDQGALFDQNNMLVEATSANILVINQGQQPITPRMAFSGVHGSLRQNLLRKKLIGLSDLTEQDLITADEVYLINSVFGLQKVVLYQGFEAKQRWSVKTDHELVASSSLLRYVHELFH